MSSAILNMMSSAAAGGAPPAWMQFLPLVAMVAIFWFLILRPQMRQQKEHRNKVSSLQKGDQVLTGGGVIGKVIKVDDNYAEVEIAANTRVKILKTTIADVIDPKAAVPAND
ncbi:MAG: preprotein translocase subunit YajC [Novosphingobium sp.]|nr:preprotein translocase subunit YajC [Novosphingobium sp.]